MPSGFTIPYTMVEQHSHLRPNVHKYSVFSFSAGVNFKKKKRVGTRIHIGNR